MHILGLIPARGGSKGIPGKNTVLLHGKPLLFYTTEAAKGSKRLTRIIVSTDDKDIAETARTKGIEVPFLRPSSLAADDTPMVDVAAHALLELARVEEYSPDVLVLLQSTSPLRSSSHIDAAITLLLESNADTVVSVTEVPHQFSPSSLMKLQDGKLLFMTKSPPVLQRQSKEIVYARNGPAILVTRVSLLREKKSLYGERISPFLMDRESSVDIDDTADLAYAEFLLERRAGKP